MPERFKDKNYRLKIYKHILTEMIKLSREHYPCGTASICMHLKEYDRGDDYKPAGTMFPPGYDDNRYIPVNRYTPLNILLPELERPHDRPNDNAWWGSMQDYDLRIQILNKAINKLTKHKTILSWVVQQVTSLFSRR